ncbi:MAG: hypothetical protein ACP5C3_01755 [Methanomicrobiales archaeon]
MDEDFIRKLKIIAIISLIIGLIAAIFYLGYGFFIIWQAMAAGIIIGFLLILVLVLLGFLVYLWLKNLYMKREFKKIEKKLEMCRAELNRQKAKKIPISNDHD